MRTKSPTRFRLSVSRSFGFTQLHTAGKKTAVFRIYESGAQAEKAVDQILAAGLLPDNQRSKEFAYEKNTRAPEGTAAGVTLAGVVGALAIPALGPFIAAGPIMAFPGRLGRRRPGRRIDRSTRRYGHPGV